MASLEGVLLVGIPDCLAGSEYLWGRLLEPAGKYRGGGGEGSPSYTEKNNNMKLSGDY